jgi:glycosyltransferase involved in cell wall biosynthesis
MRMVQNIEPIHCQAHYFFMQSSSPHLPTVSIVTPSFNQARFLEETIHSVLAQDYPDIEYILVDGGSTDGSVEIIQKYAGQISWWVSEKDQGHADALNKGFAHANGEILAWLNSDDTYYPGAVSEAVNYLQAHPEVGMVYGDADLTDENGRVIGRFAARQTNYRRLLRGSVHIPQATTFFRAALWRQIGSLDLDLFFAFDYNFWVQVAKVSRLQYLSRLWATFRLHSQGKSVRFDDRCYPDMLKVYQRETGRWFSWLWLRAKARRIFYAWLPLRARLFLRRIFIL